MRIRSRQPLTQRRRPRGSDFAYRGRSLVRRSRAGRRGSGKHDWNYGFGSAGPLLFMTLRLAVTRDGTPRYVTPKPIDSMHSSLAHISL
jgi:hypothetical protein